ncbi:MAG: PEP-CTERM sorting domain-containing protein [Planctomycetota bacterium]
MVSKSSLCVGVLAATAGTAATGQIFSETFDDGNAATRWSAPIVDSELGTFDGEVDYAFDYSTVGIGAAPGGTTTTGIKFLANLTDDGSVDEGESIGVIANGLVLPSTDYSITMDVYAFSDGSSGSTTEYITLGAHTGAVNAPGDNGLNDDVPFRFGLSQGNGLNYQTTAEGGSATDYFRFEDADNAGGGTETGLGSSEPNTFLNEWVTIELSSLAGIVSYVVNGVTVDTFDNTAGTFDGGSILIGLNDAFNSAAGPGLFTVIDNVAVTVIPEPASLALLGLGGLAMLGRRRCR